MRQLIVTLVAITAMLTGLYLSARHFADPRSVAQPVLNSALVGSQQPEFSLRSSTGEFVSQADFYGQTLLINFWATWCVPCRNEMPMLMGLQRQYGPAGLRVVGIALDDAESVRNFVQTYGIAYPILVGDADVFATSVAYGNVAGVLPYSVLVDKDGIVRWQYAGEVQPDEISSLLSSLL